MYEEERQDQPVNAEGGGDGHTTSQNGEPAANAQAELQASLAAEKQKAAENLAGWQRAAADFSNYRRRADQERQELVRSANADLIRRLLPVLDDFDRAFATLKESPDCAAWTEGVALIDRKLSTILEQEGVQPFDSVGQPFDPAFHEAIIHEESEPEQAGMVTGEVQKGYKFRDRVLRPALVRVGRGRTA